MYNKIGTRLSQFFAALMDFLTEPYPGSRPRWVTWAWLAALYLLGLFLWGTFMNWGRIPFRWLDWAEVTAPRIAFVQDVLRHGQLPLHMPDASALRGVTDRFMTLPDVILAPQMVLLLVMDVGRFVLANTLLMYTIGALGLLWFWRKYRLSPLAFAVLFLLFNFNGNITSHFSVGHVNFAGYFLFPWLLALVIRLVESPPGRAPGWGWVAAVSFLLFFMLLDGSFHMFVWWLIFLGLVGLVSWRWLPLVLKTIVLAGLLGAVRLLPPVMYVNRFNQDFLAGYPSVYDLWNGLANLRYPYDALASRSLLTQLGWWEFDLYVGLIGAVFVLVFGLGGWLKRLKTPEGYPVLLLPSLALVIFSIGRAYRVLRLLPLPILAGERVTSRMIILPFVLVILLGAAYFQRWLDARRGSHPAAKWALVGAVVLLLSDLWQHIKVWRVNVAADAFPDVPVDLAQKVVANHADPAYTNLLIAGAALTVLAAAFLIFMAIRERRMNLEQTPGARR